MNKTMLKRLVALSLLCMLAACSSSKPGLPGQKVGKPYMISGKMYFPSADLDYDETGMASWYGPGFHGKYTANGEVFNQNALTAAHPTLPMPSIVRVTNLQNNKSILVRVNDRGPFAGGRIIDLSKGSAEKLDIHGKGLAKVRVQYLHTETQAYLDNNGIKAAPAGRDKSTQYASKSRREREERREDMTIAENEGGEAPVESVQSSDLAEFKDEPKQSRKLSLIRSAEAAETEPRPAAVTSKPLAQETAEDDDADEVQTASVKPLIDTSSEAQPGSSDNYSTAPASARAFMAPPKKPNYIPKNNASATASTPAKNYDGGALVQAGAFSSEANANALASKLRPMGRVEVAQVEVSGRTLYRVRVQTDAADASKAVERAKASGAPDAHLVHN